MILSCFLIISLIGEISEDNNIAVNRYDCTIERGASKIEWFWIDNTGKMPVDANLNVLISQNDSLTIPAGRYLLNNELIIQHPCVINGNGAVLISQTIDAPAAILINAPGVEVNNLQVECDNKASKYEGRIHGVVISGDYFRGNGIIVSNANQNAFDIRGTGCVLEHCKAINSGYAGFRTINVLKGKMKKDDAWCNILNCESLGYAKKGFVNNGGMGLLVIEGFLASPKNENSEAAILLESSESSHNYEARISNVVAQGIWGNGIKQKAFERVSYKNCTIESRDGASLRLHPHRNKKNGERNAYVEIVDCKLIGASYCINGTGDIQSLNTPDTLIIRNSELKLTKGTRIIDVIKNNVYVIGSTLQAANTNSTAIIIRSPNVKDVSVSDCVINTKRVFGYARTGGTCFSQGAFKISNTCGYKKIFGVRYYDDTVIINNSRNGL